jgi:NTE family protein
MAIPLRFRASFLFIILLNLLFMHLCCAQDSAAPENRAKPRPRIGLALSGGGALGIAEIGVIRWLEENHIPVDRIAGTSMGSIIAAMYATGMSPADIQQFAEKINWNQALLSEPSYPDLSFRRKQDRRTFQVDAQLGLKSGLNGPNGLNPGQSVGLLLDQIALPEFAVTNFDAFPIPFRCVATDMISGEAVVLREGPLGQALRASMAIPGVFTPVTIGGRVLADGGMVENIPVETVRAMDADVVIAVQLLTPPAKPAELDTLTGMLSRSVDIMITQNESRSLALAQAKVTVDVSGFDISDYSRIKQLIDLGYKSAANQSAALLPYAIADPEQWQQYLAARAARKGSSPQTVAKIVVTGSAPDTDRRIEHRLNKALHGTLNIPKLDMQLSRIDGEGEFDSIGYESLVENGVPELRVIAHEKPYGPPFVDFAVNVEGSGVAAFDFSAGARVTFMDVGHHGGEWRNDFLLGSSNLGRTEFFQPILGSHFFFSSYAFASKFSRNSFDGLSRVAVFGDERAGGGLDFGHETRRTEIRIGYENFDGKLSPLIGGSGLPTASGNTGQFRTRFVWDGLDNPAVPGSGTRFVVDSERVLQSPGILHPIWQLSMRNTSFIPVGGKTSLFLVEAGGSTFRNSAGPFQIFSLGGPFRLGAYLPDEFLGNHYAYSSLGFRRDLYTLPQLVGGKIYWAGWYEAGTAFGTLAANPGPVVVRGTANLGILADTFLGPVALAGSVSPTGQSRINFSIGRIF